MYSEKLRQELTELAVYYAKANRFKIDDSHKTAVIFENIQDNFHPESFKDINANWHKRLDKDHSNVKGKKELQSSNSSDALLMNIFCYPEIKKWSGLAKLFSVKKITDIKFGYNPILNVNGKPEPRPTEIDMVINDEIFCEAKLTETEFQEGEVAKVENYENFKTVFEPNSLKLNISKKKYLNYQLIRNILAAYKENKRFILICDAQRPDLMKEFYNTVICIKDVNLRQRCEIVLWQDIANNVGHDLRAFLEVKYGI